MTGEQTRTTRALDNRRYRNSIVLGTACIVAAVLLGGYMVVFDKDTLRGWLFVLGLGVFGGLCLIPDRLESAWKVWRAPKAG